MVSRRRRRTRIDRRGLILVQYGISRPGETTLSIIHTFGHGLTRSTDLHQGVAHGVVAPHVLRYLFENVDWGRDLLVGALDTDANFGTDTASEADAADAAVTAVEDVRDALGLPSRLRDVDGPEPTEFPDVARAILDDPFMANAPSGLDPTTEEIEAVLQKLH